VVRHHRIWLHIVLLATLAEAPLSAQSAGSPQAPESADENPLADAADAIADSSTAKQYAPALDGSGLISLNQQPRFQVFYGGSLASGWDSNLTGEPDGPSGGIFTLSPYVGIRGTTSKTNYLIQYQPTIARNTSNAISNDTFQRATVLLSGFINPRWHWNFNAEAAHGQDSLRLITPTATVAIGETLGIAPSASQYSARADTSTLIAGTLGFTYLKSEIESVNIMVNNSYSRVTSVGGNTAVTQASIGYNHGLSPKISLTATGQYSISFGSIECSSFDGAFGAVWQVSKSTRFEVNGGPAFSSKGCNTGENFIVHGAFDTRLSAQSRLYLVASRQFGVSYLGQGVWQENASAGYQRSLSRSSSIDLNLGYSNSANISSGSYHGIFAEGSYSWMIERNVSTMLSYRYYRGNTGPGAFDGHAIIFSLVWTPNLGHLSR